MDTKENDQPSPYEVAKLAALVIKKIEYHSRNDAHLVEEAVNLSLRILKESKRQLSDTTDPGLQRDGSFHYLGKYRSAMRVQNHTMPELPIEFITADRVKLDDFLKSVIGLTEKTDRMKWFRAYLIYRASEDLPTNVSDSSVIRMGEPSRNPMKRYPDKKSSGVENEVATELEKLRSHGTDAYCYYAKGFREWRLTMKSPSTKSDDPSNIDLCIANAAL
jgi:hypothetical protein